MICPHCQKENLDDKVVCVYCNQPLRANVSFQKECQQSPNYQQINSQQGYQRPIYQQPNISQGYQQPQDPNYQPINNQQGYQPPIYQQPMYQQPKKSPASLILGIVGIVFAWLFAIVGHITSIIGIVLGIKEYKNTGDMKGLVVSIIGEVCSIFSSIIGAVTMTAMFY